MDIHEYHAKELLAGYGVPIQPGAVAYTADQASFVASELGGWHWAVKAQIHSGARGKAGGIKLCKIVQRVYIEVAEKFERELYFGIVLDRKAERVRIIASAQGGMEIEDIAKTSPDAILQVIVEPAVGLLPFQAREIAFGLGLNIKQVSRAVTAILGAYQAFRELDASMLEINPLVVTKDDRVIALDAKMSFDDNALFRHARLAEMRDLSQEDPREAEASQDNLSYVGLAGDIGCIINGAGLAMATMDTIKYAGGEPANFLDVGGGASPERVAKAFKLVLSDSNVKVILVNIFAGINRCDWVAEGVVKAVRDIGIKVPLVVRLAGTNETEGRKIIADSGLPIISADTLAEAAQKSVAAARSAGSKQVAAT